MKTILYIKFIVLFLLFSTLTYVDSLAQCPSPGSIGTSTTGSTVTLSATTVALSQSDINSSKISHVWSGGSGSLSQMSNSGGSWSSTYTVNPSSTTTYTVKTVCNGVSSGTTSVTVTVGGSGGSGGSGGTTAPSPMPSLGYNGTPCNGKELLFYFNPNGNTTCSAVTWSYSSGGVATTVPGNPNQIKITWPASSSVSYVRVSAFATCNGIYKEYKYPADGSNMTLDISRSPTVLLAATTYPAITCENDNSASLVFTTNASGLPSGYTANYQYYIDNIFIGSSQSVNAVTAYTYNFSANLVPLIAGQHIAKTVMNFSDLSCLLGPASSVNTSTFNIVGKDNYIVSISGPTQIDNYNVPRRYTASATTKVGPTGTLQYEWFVDDQQVLAPSPANNVADLLVSYGSSVYCKLYSDNVCEIAPAISNTITIAYPPNNYNWIKETSVLTKDILTDEAFNGLTINEGKKQLNWTYFDGLGRPKQSILVNGSPAPSKMDIIQHIIYDKYGREGTKYLPYTSMGSGSYKTDFLTKESQTYNTATSPQYQFYQATSKVLSDSKPYAETIYEPSLLGRVLKQGAPGLSWQPDADIYSMTDKTVKKRYEFNSADEVLRLSYDEATGTVSVSEVASEKYYAINQLYANKTYDERNNEMTEYLDKEGRTVCKKLFEKTENNIKQYAITYYIYDNFGSLIFVLPPEGVQKLKTLID